MPKHARADLDLLAAAKAVANAASLPTAKTDVGHGIVAGALVHDLHRAIRAVDPDWKVPPAPEPIGGDVPFSLPRAKGGAQESTQVQDVEPER